MTDGRYDLFGLTPAQIAIPNTVAEARQIVRDSAGTAIVPWGGGALQHIGYAPERYDLALSTAALNGVVDYQPADMTVTVQAGMTIESLQAVLRERGQWLPVDVAQPAVQTVGGVVATRANSLRRNSYGSIRDLLLGLSVIDGQGDLIVGGGRVVKNVAGYDLPKLYCGSYGTLGLIVEATFKVSPQPEATATVVLQLDADHNSEDALDGLLNSDILPSFIYLLSPGAARDILPADRVKPGEQYVVIGLDGIDEAVRWQIDAIGVPGGVLNEDSGAALRDELRDFSLRPASFTASFHILSSQVGAFSRMVEWTAQRAGFRASIIADAAIGFMWAHFEPSGPDADWAVFLAGLSDKAGRCGGSFIIDRMPEILRAAGTPVWSPLLPDFDLMAGIKKKLDPERMWNPGRFFGQL